MNDENEKSRVPVRTVYFNGEIVGEIPITGNDDEDLAASRRLLESKGLNQKMSLEQVMYNQAFAFAKTSAQLYDQGLKRVPRDGQLVIPWIVNSAFAIEIYLKTLGQMSGRPSRGHNISDLYSGLPDDARASILAEIPNALRDRKFTSEFDITAVISALNKAFVEWRYHYEVQRLPAIPIEATIVLMKAIHQVCAEKLRK
jgi:hypothetical protein